MSSTPDLAVERTGDIAVVALAAPAPGDEAAIHELGAALGRLLDEGPDRPRALVLDCAPVGFACSAFLGCLLRLRREALQAGTTFAVCGLNPGLAEVFRVTKFSAIVPTYPDRAAALAALAGTQAQAQGDAQ